MGVNIPTTIKLNNNNVNANIVTNNKKNNKKTKWRTASLVINK